jgi:hypothetical protein
MDHTDGGHGDQAAPRPHLGREEIRALDARLAPSRVVFRHLDDQAPDLGEDATPR